MDDEADPLENPDRYENPAPAMFDSQEEPSAAIPDTEQPQEEPGAIQEVEPTQDEPADESAENWTAAELGAWKNLQVAREEFPTEYADALADYGLTDKEVNPGNAAEINLAISRMLDAQ